ncbi:MAG: nucleotidyltransferase domain-containing protein [Deltaproteobacteria bacterium]|nr:nucleotidyltransferase domain-containing protein [Deltaproteobacteria bacterium]
MDKDKIVSLLKTYFQHKADTHAIDMAFLYGSYACGHPNIESDVDVAVLFRGEMPEDKAFDVVNTISLELSDLLKTEVNVLCIDAELSKPMLHYNAIVHGIPVFIKNFTQYADIKLQAISQMEDFSIFGIKWQSEIAKKRLEMLNRA